VFLNLNATEKTQLIKVTFVGNIVPGSLTHEHHIFMIINIMFMFGAREPGNEAKTVEWKEAFSYSGVEPILTHTALNHLILNLHRSEEGEGWRGKL